jgi:hypothetical protein
VNNCICKEEFKEGDRSKIINGAWFASSPQKLAEINEIYLSKVSDDGKDWSKTLEAIPQHLPEIYSQSSDADKGYYKNVWIDDNYMYWKDNIAKNRFFDLTVEVSGDAIVTDVTTVVRDAHIEPGITCAGTLNGPQTDGVLYVNICNDNSKLDASFSLEVTCEGGVVHGIGIPKWPLPKQTCSSDITQNGEGISMPIEPQNKEPNRCQVILGDANGKKIEVSEWKECKIVIGEHYDPSIEPGKDDESVGIGEWFANVFKSIGKWISNLAAGLKWLFIGIIILAVIGGIIACVVSMKGSPARAMAGTQYNVRQIVPRVRGYHLLPRYTPAKSV